VSEHEKVIEEIREERKRQMAVEGWTPQHDDEHLHGEMADAAACYAATKKILVRTRLHRSGSFCGSYSTTIDAWPWACEWDKRVKHPRRRQLVIAAALIVAELERLDRKAALDAARRDK
jgi:hypothetical protein